MSTSLAEQLQRLAVPQTSILTRDKKRPSLLFDPKEAAGLSKETVYQIGLDGFEELKNRNTAFAQFENTLFHITSKEFERAVESAEANQRLNKNIRKFLLLLSPHFLFNCSYKALEWLIYRYHVNDYNKEDLLMLILPYHETNIFVRVLQLLNLNEPGDKWRWLKPLQRPGVHLTKQALYNHAASDAHFLQFVSNFVLSVIKEHERPTCLTTVFNFYWTTFTGALEYSKEVSEPQVSQMLPVLLKGLSSNIPDFAAGSYIIMAKLVTKTQLSNKILEKFVEKIAQVNVKILVSEAILVLVVLYQSQETYKKMSDMAVKSLSGVPTVANKLEDVNASGVNIYPFLGPLLCGAVNYILTDKDNEACKTFVDELFAKVKIDDSFIHALLSSILNVYSQKRTCSAGGSEWLKELIQKIERQHPLAFDSAVKKIMTPSQDPTLAQQRKALRRLVQNSIDIHDSFELFEKLYHASSTIRVEGLKALHSKYKLLKEKDPQMLENALFDRLNDDSSDVVMETLRLFKTAFPQCINMERLCDLLIKLLNRCQTDRDHWWNVSFIALDVLCCHFDDSNIKIFVAMLPYLLTSSEQDLQAVKHIILSDYAKKSKLLKPLLWQLTRAKRYLTFCNLVYGSIVERKQLLNVESLVNGLKGMSEYDTCILHKFMATLLLSCSLPPDCDAAVSNLVLDIIEIFVKTSKTTVIKGTATVADYIALAKRNKFTLQGFLYFLEQLIVKTRISGDINRMDFSKESDITTFYARILKIIIKGACSHKMNKSTLYLDALNVFTTSCNMTVQTFLELLLNISIANENKHVTEELQAGCVRTAKQLLCKQESDAMQPFLEFNQVIVPFILVNLGSPNEETRQNSMKMCEYLVQNGNDGGNYFKLLVGLLYNQEEILMDHEQAPLVMFNLFSSSEETDSALKRILNVLVQMVHNADLPIYLRAGLISLLAHVNNAKLFSETSALAVDILNSKELKIAESEIIIKNVARFDSSVAEQLTEKSPIWEFIKLCIQSDDVTVKGRSKTACPPVLVMNQVDRNLFSKLSRQLQPVLLDLIITVATNSQNPDVLYAAAHVFKQIDLDVTLVLEQLQKMRDVRSPKQSESKRKRRVSVIPTADILDTIEWKKGVTILEFIQDKKKIRNVALLMPILFEILKKCLDFDEQASVEYPKQLLLSTILHCCGKIEEESLPENAFNMQLVVQCIRASQNPQTHHHALLLLSKAALLMPKQVLHHIIAIFTFVGSSVLRHDDSYSFQIISKIIETIIPILIQDGTVGSIVTVLRVFVDAILDVPEHRRMPLFKHLLTRLDAKQNLHLFILIVFEAHVVHGHVEKQKTGKSRSLTDVDEVPKRLDIAADLCRGFSPEIVIVNCIKILEYLRKLPEEKGEDAEDIIFDIKRYTPKQFRHYKYVIITFVTNLLASQQFVNQVASLSDAELLDLENLFKEMIINILNYIQDTTKVAERNVKTAQAQYWKVILHHSYDALDAVNALLTNQMFLLVIRGLMVYSISAVRKRALELLSNKLQHNPSFCAECDSSELQNLIVSPLVNIIKTIGSSDVEPEQELVIQKGLFALKLLIKQLAPDNPDKFVPILEFITDLVKNSSIKMQENTLASFVLCLAELCGTLRARAISSLSKFMPVLIKLLKSQRRFESPSLLLISTVTTVHKILDSLPLFVSPYLEKLLYEVTLLSCKWNSQQDQRANAFFTKLNGIQQKIGSMIPLRVLLPATENSCNNLVGKEKFEAIKPLMATLSESLSNLKGSEVQASLPELTAFFLNVLQFRANGRGTYEQANEVEEHVMRAFVTLILKLSESSFRPLYYKLFDWAVRTDAKTERVITFYNLSAKIASDLKGLFVLFAGHFLNNAASLLDSCNPLKSSELYFEEETKNVALLESILKTLHMVFLYDSQKFVTKERFDVLLQPVVDQLENTLGGMESLEARAKAILTPCIVQFAVATADDALWKQMNYQILLKTRHNSPRIRLVALECLSETAKRLGEDFLPLLPETIPFLAELLEDEEESVEKACQKAVQELEKVLGEPLQKYF